ncbi:MKI67 FHA domain-interacting nucleolar phosphoprotein-like [Ixodes scapularis]
MPGVRKLGTFDTDSDWEEFQDRVEQYLITNNIEEEKQWAVHPLRSEHILAAAKWHGVRHATLKTGRSRGYAFVEFLSEDVAKIAAETMDGYLLFNKILKCSVLPRDRVPKGLFKGLNFPFPVRKEVVRIVNNRRRSTEEDSRSAQRRLARLQRSNARLSKMGLKYQFQPEVPEELLRPTEANASGSSGYNLVVDSSDTSLTFKTPPGAKRVLRKRSLVDITPQHGKKTPRQDKKTLQQGKKTPLLTSTPATATRRKKPQ